MNDRGSDTAGDSRPPLIRLDEHAVVDGIRVRLGAQLVVVVHEDTQAQVYVSHAPALDLYSQGRTEHEAVRALEHAIRSYVLTAHGRGSLGWILHHSALSSQSSGDDPRGSSSRQYVRVTNDRPVPASIDTPASVELSTL